MRRAITAVGLTAAGLIALLDYRSGSPSTARASGAATPAGPTTTAPATTAPTDLAPTGSTTVPGPAQSATGEDVSYRYGEIEVRLTVGGGRITAVDTPTDSSPDFRSSAINGQAVPELTSEVLAAQGATIDAVSGATYTSDAFIQSLRSALARAGR